MIHGPEHHNSAEPAYGIHEDPFLRPMKTSIRYAVRVLALFMTFVIIWSVFDVFFIVARNLAREPFMLLGIEDIMETFGAFMAVLIAIEIFINITIYLQENAFHVRIVMATALMAIARKIVILDQNKADTESMMGIAAIMLATSIGYFLIVFKERKKSGRDKRSFVINRP